MNHFYPEYQSIIADGISNELIKEKQKIICDEILDIDFSLIGTDTLKNLFSYSYKETNIMKKEVFKFYTNSRIEIPDTKYLCGIFYWSERKMPYISLRNKSLYITKNLNINFDGFFCRPIASLCLGGAPGGVLSLTNNTKGSIFEPDNCDQYYIQTGVRDYIWINGLLLSDKNTYFYGRKFYQKNAEIFMSEKKYLTTLSIDKIQL